MIEKKTNVNTSLCKLSFSKVTFINFLNFNRIVFNIFDKLIMQKIKRIHFITLLINKNKIKNGIDFWIVF